MTNISRLGLLAVLRKAEQLRRTGKVTYKAANT
jgi:hypothetical protein